MESRTDSFIVTQTNELARRLLKLQGYVVPEDSKFHGQTDERLNHAWQMACEAQEFLTATDPNDALGNLEAEEEQTWFGLNDQDFNYQDMGDMLNDGEFELEVGDLYWTAKFKEGEFVEGSVEEHQFEGGDFV
jgi:hypothetical protein